MQLAHMVATRSTCLRRQVGAVVVKNNRILTTGYNGAPSGLPHCLEAGCLREELAVPSGERHEICRGTHAEQNAIVQAALLGTDIKDATIYVTTFPCSLCAKILINARINKVVYEGTYPDSFARQLFQQAHIELTQFHPPGRKKP